MSHQQYPFHGGPHLSHGSYYQQQPPMQGYGQPPPPQGGYYQQSPPHNVQPYGQQPPCQGQGHSPPGQFYPPHGYPQQHAQQPPYGVPSPYNAHAPPPQTYHPSPSPYEQQQAPYGVPPQQHPYGPPSPYNAPQPPAQIFSPTSPSLGYGPPQSINWNGDRDAEILRKAMKGFGTDEGSIIRTLATKDPLQIHTIRDAFSRLFRRNLEEDIKKETSGYFEKGLVALVRGPLLNDVHQVHDSIAGLGTKETLLNDVLLGRSNADLNAIKNAYVQTFHKKMDVEVLSDLSMKTKDHFDIVLKAQRAEDTAPVIKADVDRDVFDIYKATVGRRGTDEIAICSIMSTRNDNQIRAIAHEYQKKYPRDLEKVFNEEFSGHMRDALLFQLRHGLDKYMHQAQLLEDAMAGAGTKDVLLVTRIVRAHWDRNNMENVRGAYEQRYRRNLAVRLKGEVRGDYEKLMLACIGEKV